jgi:hypothetical protein
MIKRGATVSYRELCNEEGGIMQRGVNHRPGADASVALIGIRPEAKYSEQVSEDGSEIVFVGEEVPPDSQGRPPEKYDQPMRDEKGKLTQNGRFYDAAIVYKQGRSAPEVVTLYGEVKDDAWVYRGKFKLIDSWQDDCGGRKVFKFKLRRLDED